MDGLTQSQIARLAKLPDDHRVVGEREGSPVVECPDGRLVCVHQNGQLVATTLVSRVQSYLHVARC
jgi:hypothetical protein